MVDPPVLAGAVHEMVAWALPGEAVTMVGAPGTVAGTMADEGEDAALEPMALVAMTVKV